jgi:hypothetical protein
MAKLPRHPDLHYLQTLDPPIEILPVGTRLWRVYFRGGKHPTDWYALRYVGPTTGGRFDHHLPREDGLPHKQLVGVMYAALDAVTCLAEVYQKRRFIYRRRTDPWLVAFDLEQALPLLDLTGDFPTQIGSSMALMSGPRSSARAWARGFYTSYPDTQGLYYPSSMHANKPAVVLNERAEKNAILPESPQFHRSLSDPAMITLLRNAARTLGYVID